MSKQVLIAGGVLVAVAGFLLAELLAVMTPSSWPITPGSLRVTKVRIAGEDYVMIQGDGINKLGQIQSIDVGFDEPRKRIVVNRYIIRWNPFTRITVNNQWPVFYLLESFPPGKYSVVYMSSDGEATARNRRFALTRRGD